MWTKFTFSCLHLKAAALFMGWCICLNECPAIIDFSSPIFFLLSFLYDCVTGVVQQESLALAHLLTNWLWKELGHVSLPTVAVVKLRHGFLPKRPHGVSLSFPFTIPTVLFEFASPHCREQQKVGWACSSLFSPSFSFPFWSYILLGLCEKAARSRGRNWEFQPLQGFGELVAWRLYTQGVRENNLAFPITYIELRFQFKNSSW